MPNLIKARIGAAEVLDSGTIVVPPNVQASLEIGGVNYSLNFKDTGGALAFHSTRGLLGGSFIFENFTNPFGSHVDLRGFTVGNDAAMLSMAIYAIGSPDPARLIHYTLHRAVTPA